MRSNVSKQSYFLGLSMGLCISILVVTIFFSLNNINVYPEQSDIINENINLKSEIVKKDLEIEQLSKEIDNKTKEINDISKKIEQEKEADIIVEGEVVLLDIRQDMSNSEIADLIIKNGVYNYKNDILMVMEILNFDRYKYSEVLGEYGYISDSYELNKLLKEIESNQYAVTEALYYKNLVKHKNSFMKLLYLFDINTKIKYGQKEFKKNSSLRDVCDALIS